VLELADLVMAGTDRLIGLFNNLAGFGAEVAAL